MTNGIKTLKLSQLFFLNVYFIYNFLQIDSIFHLKVCKVSIKNLSLFKAFSVSFITTTFAIAFQSFSVELFQVFRNFSNFQQNVLIFFKFSKNFLKIFYIYANLFMLIYLKFNTLYF